jgi:RHS repeat-associated protein
LGYDAYGGRSATAGTYHPSDLQYAGAWGYQTEWASSSEPGLGLEYLQQRCYDPAVGRFISPDPIGLVGGANLYGYVASNPVSSTDSSGLAEDPRRPSDPPGTIGISLAGFIAASSSGGFEGDNRGFSANSSRFRFEEQIVLLPNGTAWRTPKGGITRFHGFAKQTNSDALHALISYEGCGRWNIHLWGSPKNALLDPFAPKVDYDLEIAVTPDGVEVSGFHDAFPSYEVYVYRPGQAPVHKYGWRESSVVHLISPAFPFIKVNANRNWEPDPEHRD